MNRDQAAEKIKKCLQLAKSAEAHEAAAAMRQAQKLMTEFGLGEADVELLDVGEARIKAGGLRLQAWETTLAGIVAEAFGCAIYSSINIFDERKWVFVGVKPGNDIAAYAFDVLRRQCVRLRAAHVSAQPRNCKPSTKTARGDTFAMAWVHAVEALVERFAGGERNTALVEAYMKANHPNLSTAKVNNRSSGRAMDAAAGARAAEGAYLNRGVDGPAARHLITR